MRFSWGALLVTAVAVLATQGYESWLPSMQLVVDQGVPCIGTRRCYCRNVVGRREGDVMILAGPQ
eukprot:scaffold4319_cov188-Prasinococcus_capsulatus_cf.AAC.1